MLIRSKIERPEGTTVTLHGMRYHFRPRPGDDSPFPPHVCEVADEDHVAQFLSVPEGFEILTEAQATAQRPADDFAEDGAPAVADPAPANPAPDPAEGLSRDDMIAEVARLTGRMPHPNISDDTLRERIREASAH